MDALKDAVYFLDKAAHFIRLSQEDLPEVQETLAAVRKQLVERLPVENFKATIATRK